MAPHNIRPQLTHEATHFKRIHGIVPALIAFDLPVLGLCCMVSAVKIPKSPERQSETLLQF